MSLPGEVGIGEFVDAFEDFQRNLADLSENSSPLQSYLALVAKQPFNVNEARLGLSGVGGEDDLFKANIWLKASIVSRSVPAWTQYVASATEQPSGHAAQRFDIMLVTEVYGLALGVAFALQVVTAGIVTGKFDTDRVAEEVQVASDALSTFCDEQFWLAAAHAVARCRELAAQHDALVTPFVLLLSFLARTLAACLVSSDPVVWKHDGEAGTGAAYAPARPAAGAVAAEAPAWPCDRLERRGLEPREGVKLTESHHGTANTYKLLCAMAKSGILQELAAGVCELQPHDDLGTGVAMRLWAAAANICHVALLIARLPKNARIDALPLLYLPGVQRLLRLALERVAAAGCTAGARCSAGASCWLQECSMDSLEPDVRRRVWNVFVRGPAAALEAQFQLQSFHRETLPLPPAPLQLPRLCAGAMESLVRLHRGKDAGARAEDAAALDANQQALCDLLSAIQRHLSFEETMAQAIVPDCLAAGAWALAAAVDAATDAVAEVETRARWASQHPGDAASRTLAGVAASTNSSGSAAGNVATTRALCGGGGGADVRSARVFQRHQGIGDVSKAIALFVSIPAFEKLREAGRRRCAAALSRAGLLRSLDAAARLLLRRGSGSDFDYALYKVAGHGNSLLSLLLDYTIQPDGTACNETGAPAWDSARDLGLFVTAAKMVSVTARKAAAEADAALAEVAARRVGRSEFDAFGSTAAAWRLAMQLGPALQPCTDGWSAPGARPLCIDPTCLRTQSAAASSSPSVPQPDGATAGAAASSSSGAAANGAVGSGLPRRRDVRDVAALCLRHLLAGTACLVDGRERQLRNPGPIADSLVNGGWLSSSFGLWDDAVLNRMEDCADALCGVLRWMTGPQLQPLRPLRVLAACARLLATVAAKQREQQRSPQQARLQQPAAAAEATALGSEVPRVWVHPQQDRAEQRVVQAVLLAAAHPALSRKTRIMLQRDRGFAGGGSGVGDDSRGSGGSSGDACLEGLGLPEAYGWPLRPRVADIPCLLDANNSELDEHAFRMRAQQIAATYDGLRAAELDVGEQWARAHKEWARRGWSASSEATAGRVGGDGRDGAGVGTGAVEEASTDCPAADFSRMCGNPLCASFMGPSEASAGRKKCARCRAVRYCCAACQAQHWREGHSVVCR